MIPIKFVFKSGRRRYVHFTCSTLGVQRMKPRSCLLCVTVFLQTVWTSYSSTSYSPAQCKISSSKNQERKRPCALFEVKLGKSSCEVVAYHDGELPSGTMINCGLKDGGKRLECPCWQNCRETVKENLQKWRHAENGERLCRISTLKYLESLNATTIPATTPSTTSSNASFTTTTSTTISTTTNSISTTSTTTRTSPKAPTAASTQEEIHIPFNGPTNPTSTKGEIFIPFNEPTNATTRAEGITVASTVSSNTSTTTTRTSSSTSHTEAGLFTSSLSASVSTNSLSMLQRYNRTEEAEKNLMKRAASNLLVLSVCMTFVLFCQLVFIKLMRTTRRRHYTFTGGRFSEPKKTNNTTITMQPMQQAASSNTIITTTTTLESIAVEKKQPQKAVQLSAESIELKTLNENVGAKRPGMESSKKRHPSQNQKVQLSKMLKSLARTMKEEKTLDLYDHVPKREEQRNGDPSRGKISENNVKNSNGGILGTDTQKDDFFALPKR
ncbi:hypothetical protein Y032_0024g1078 [Ancylostoma ceylanicum]|uniref:Uncharacterized protein n=2 Tax=Ancylostoma ceylanicum TaxID=53326 RepID=A0A016UW50_9BILA|nr:hypothetical protein Y032_0024g1078 [Ancylostoma ceylanicum]